MQEREYGGLRGRGEEIRERLENRTQEIRDEIRELHVKYDRMYFGNVKERREGVLENGTEDQGQIK